MSDTKKDCSTGACPVDKSKDTSKLVKSTDLPLTGNPYPPKDVIQNDSPGSLEQSVTSARTAVQPYVAPIGSAFARVNEIASIGWAHSQSTFQGLSENQNAFASGFIIAGSSFFGLLLARKKGLFKKILFATTFGAGSAAVCYPEESKKYLDIGRLIAVKEFPELAMGQYQKLSGQISTMTSNEKKETEATKKKD